MYNLDLGWNNITHYMLTAQFLLHDIKNLLLTTNFLRQAVNFQTCLPNSTTSIHVSPS